MLHAVFSSMFVTHRAWQFVLGGMEDDLEVSIAFLSAHSSGGHGHLRALRNSVNLGGRPSQIKEDQKRGDLQWRRTKTKRKLKK